MAKAKSMLLADQRNIVSLLAILILQLLAPSTTGFCPVVICPGFGNDAIDYQEPLKQPREVGLVSCLERRGFDPSQIYIVPIQRLDWIKVFTGGLLDFPNFYLNKAQPTGRGYGWYLERVKETVDTAYANSDENKVLLLGHSAGGWLARAAMGDGTWDHDAGVATSDRIRALVTIGAIHEPPADASKCVTRGALAYTSENYPGAFLAKDGISYISVGGNAVVGKKLDNSDNNNGNDLVSEHELRRKKASNVAYTAYKSVCGEGTVEGDGVVPLEWSLLEGSRQLSLDGVVHSINEAGTTLPTDRWYGAEEIIDQWLPTVLEEANLNKNTNAPLLELQKFWQSLTVESK